MRSHPLLLVALAVAKTALSTPTVGASIYQTHAESALESLQTFYNDSTGLWHSYGVSWWQSANALTTLANMVSLNSSYAQTVADHVFPTTFTQAQALNIKDNHHTKRQESTETPWTNGYYDDEGWWAMAWIRVYDVTKNTTYLDAAEGLFNDMTGGWGTNCSSQGLWWDKAHTSIAPISNALFMEVAAYLANRVPAKRDYYVGWALKEWAFMQSSGFYVPEDHLVLGSIDLQTCKPNPIGHGFTYTQGSLVQALTSLTHATGNKTYLTTASLVASAVIANMTKDGILTEPGIDQAHPGNDAPQFKGVFMRGLMALEQASSTTAFTQFAQNNAASIWNSDRSGAAMLGPDWSGPFYGPADASPQSSAMDALVAAWSASI